MSNLTLNCSFPQNMTLIPNEFLDHHMPSANGEFVKVYLLLIRMSGTGAAFTLSDAADILSCTEKDILRALRYWEKCGLIELTQNTDGELTGVSIPPIQNSHDVLLPDGNRRDGDLNVSTEQSKDAEPPETALSAEKSSGDKKEPEESSGKSLPEIDIPGRKQLTAERISQLEDMEDFMYLLFVSGQYLGRNLTRTDIDTLGYFFDELHMSVDLIEYLIEYCVSNNHTGIRYIETVGLAWHSEGITTVQEAKETQGQHHRDYYTIFKSLGIRNHSPISAEIQLMDKWMNTYRFTMDMIQEACTRTVMRTAKPTLAYVDGILSRWFDENIRTLEDVKKEDDSHRKVREKSRKTGSGKKSRTPSGNFYNFEQRSYDSELENKLLGIAAGSPADDTGTPK